MKSHPLQPPKSAQPLSQIQELRHEIAAIAARYVAEDGATYAIAKQKAAQQVLGPRRFSHDLLPDNGLIEQQVQVYHQLFFSEAQPARLLQLRRLALEIMLELAQFNPHLSGAVLSGSAGVHAEIVIHLFVDNGKEVAIYLLNQGVQFDVSESQQESDGRFDPTETYSFTRDNEGIHLVLFDTDDLRRTSPKKSPRAPISALRKLIEESTTP